MKKTELICYIAFCTTFLFSRMFFSSSLFIDFCIEHITVDNTVVEDGMYDYCLKYDAVHDVITVYQYDNKSFSNGGIDIFFKIELYYDQDGYETVHVVQNYTDENGGSYSEVIYTPNRYYYFAMYYGSNNMYHLTSC